MYIAPTSSPPTNNPFFLSLAATTITKHLTQPLPSLPTDLNRTPTLNCRPFKLSPLPNSVKMHLPISILTLALAIGKVSTAPAPATISPLGTPPSSVVPKESAAACAYNDRLGPRVAEFTSWITDCGDRSGHTTGMRIAWRGYNGLCFPLPEDTRALEVRDILGGCRGMCFFYSCLLVKFCCCLSRLPAPFPEK